MTYCKRRHGSLFKAVAAKNIQVNLFAKGTEVVSVFVVLFSKFIQNLRFQYSLACKEMRFLSFLFY